MQRRSVSEFKHNLEENGVTLRTFELKGQIENVKVVHSKYLVNHGKHMKVLDRMNLNNSEIMDLPCD